MDTIGSHIKKLRLERKLTLKELSNLSGVSIPFISGIERDSACPSYNSLQSLAKGLGITVPEIVNVNNVYQDKLSQELDEIKKFLFFVKAHIEKYYIDK